jgi:hypothetical protein
LAVVDTIKSLEDRGEDAVFADMLATDPNIMPAPRTPPIPAA